MQALPNGGMVVSCGTGIEGCDASVIKEVPLSECLADPRRTWRSYVIALDSSGGTEWARVDSFKQNDGGGDSANDVGTTAAEYVAVDKNGNLLVTTDQGYGIGVFLLELGTPAPTPAPTQFPTLEATETMTFDVVLASETVASFDQAKQDKLKQAVVAVLGNGVQTSDIVLTITAVSRRLTITRRLAGGIQVSVQVKAKLASAPTVETTIKASTFQSTLQTKAVEQGAISSAADLSTNTATSFRVVEKTSDAPSPYPTMAPTKAAAADRIISGSPGARGQLLASTTLLLPLLLLLLL